MYVYICMHYQVNFYQDNDYNQVLGTHDIDYEFILF